MSTASFLPEDYLAKKAEHRTNLISLILFGVVMIAVVGAFFVTNRQARLVKNLQESINSQYQQAGMQIQELTRLENLRQEMVNKAELAGALVERVPRSILLAELINRMPERLSLLEFDMKSEKVKVAPPGPEKDSKGRLIAKDDKKAKANSEASEAVKRVDPPKHTVKIVMTGVAPTDLEVSKFMAELNAFELLDNVTLEYSEEKEIEGRTMRKYKINMTLDPASDVRRIDPLNVPRIKNPMTDDVQFNPINVSDTASATPRSEEGP